MRAYKDVIGVLKGIGTRGCRDMSQDKISEVWLWCTFSLALMYILLLPTSSWAHGFAGKRFFPTTFKVEDPFVSDEFSVLFGHIKEPEGKTTEVEMEYSKRIFPDRKSV